ncbi:FG-GAP-like repeat-containing protein [Nonomuraea sp. NPDC049649]|uniref:FG-GAP-like repeat-containing protein n=1 Tax=Nonomuraea sp. NPDC049649 TaxID=3155776 RepID=UPI003422FBEF
MALGTLAITPAPASAAPDFQLPFPCGQKWRLNTWAHGPALDMVKEPQSQTEGATLVAPASGTVNKSFYHSNAGNVIQINHGGGHFTTYIHLKSRSVKVGAKVSRGQTIGRVGHTGPTSNGSPHLHYEQGYDKNKDGSASWGTKNSERVTAKFDGKAYGPASGKEWRNVKSNNCSEPETPPKPVVRSGADFNRDGIGDLFATGTGTLYIWNGKGGNKFTPAIRIGSGWATYSRPIGGDFNGDGIADLAAVNAGKLHIWNGKGNNKFTSPIVTGPGWTKYASTLASLGDVNGDGHTDIAAVGDGVLYVWNGKGGNKFTPAIRIGSGWSNYSRPIGGDFNGDGIADLAAVNAGKLHIWNGKGNNKFAPAIETGPGWTEYARTLMSVGDVNKDGKADIAAINKNGELHVWNGKGGNKFTPAIRIGPGWNPHLPG